MRCKIKHGVFFKHTVHHVLYSCVIHNSDQLKKHSSLPEDDIEISLTQSEVVDDDKWW